MSRTVKVRIAVGANSDGVAIAAGMDDDSVMRGNYPRPEHMLSEWDMTECLHDSAPDNIVHVWVTAEVEVPNLPEPAEVQGEVEG